LTLRRFETVDAKPEQAIDLQKSTFQVGAESGAVADDAMLAALVGMLTPEQKAAFVAMLTAPKS
jgi:hypothetical protein